MSAQIAQTMLTTFLIVSALIIAISVLSSFFPSIRLRATYAGIEREVFLRRERTAIIMGTKKRVVSQRTGKPIAMPRARIRTNGIVRVAHSSQGQGHSARIAGISRQD